MNKNKRLNIIRGGVAKQIPGMPNYYFMKGLPHELGGIDIGKDLEVEGNEVVHVGKDNIKVYSSVPFLNGVSPAEKVLGGDNPTTVFREQEQFKKINGLKDDGTKKKLGGKDEIVSDNTRVNRPLSKRELFPTYQDYAQNERKENFANYASTIGPTKGRPQGLINVHPEFDLLTLGRGLVTDPINIGGLIKNKYKNYKVAKELYKDASKTKINTSNYSNKAIFADNLNKSNPDFINSADFLIEHARTNNPVNKRYFNAIKNKDYEELQSVVDEVFKLRAKDNKIIDANGNPISSWHTVRKRGNPNYTIFNVGTDIEPRAIYTTPDRFMSNSYYDAVEFVSHRQKNKLIDIIKKEYPKTGADYDYAYLTGKYDNYDKFINDKLKAVDWIPISSNGKQYEKHLFTYMKNPKTIDAKNSYWGNIPVGNSGYTYSTNDLERIFRNTEHDGIVIKNVKDWGPGGVNVPMDKIHGKDVYISYSPNKVKSADLITYDDKGNIIPITERFNFNKKDYRYATIPAIVTGATITNTNKKQLGGKMNNKTSGLYSLTIDGKNSLHQFSSTGESFARSAKGKVIARGGTKKRYTGEIKADDRSWIEKQYDNVKGYFMNERPDITHAARIASTLGLSELDNIEKLVTGRKRYDNPNVQTGIAPIAGRKGGPSKSKRTLASVKSKRNNKPTNVKSNNSSNNTEPISVEPKYGNNPFYTTNTYSPSPSAKVSNGYKFGKSLDDAREFVSTLQGKATPIHTGKIDPRWYAGGIGGTLGIGTLYGLNELSEDYDRRKYSRSVIDTKVDKSAKAKINNKVINKPNTISADTIKSIINDTIPADTLISRSDTIKPDTIKPDTIKSDTIRYNKPSISSKVDSTATPVKVNINAKSNSSSPSTKVSTSTFTPSTSTTTPTTRPTNTRPVNTRQTNNNGSTNNWIVPEFNTGVNTGVNNDNTNYDPIANMRASKSTNYNVDNKIRGINAKPQFPTGKINPISLDNISPVELPETPVKQSKFKTFINNAFNKPNTKDIIGAGSNIVSSIIAHNMNKNMLNDLEYSPAPITRRANKLKTKININPQIDAMRESLANYRQHVNDNTASSRVARALMNRGLNNYTSGINQLYGNKENQETELINKDRLNQQEVANANIADYNTWRANKVAFNNTIREKKSENDVGLISNINAGIQDIISRGEKRFNERQNRLALMAANPNVNPSLLRDFGIEGITDEDIRNYYKAYGNKNKKG